ncbi:MAG: Ig-like domain-containing protein [Alphaproteobacteria bacterium]|nr:Ig-like domain-containing protein [Alphaproteobacteria bacterium]
MLLSLALLASVPAHACGQSTHAWIGIEAVEHLPAGELRTLLEAPDRFPFRVLGSMFPDGGYSPLVQDGYGETAHWPPFQDTYLDWIKETWDPPYTGEAADHVAFLMGLAAHGMADQIFDGVYLTRGLLYDGSEQFGEADLSSDVAMVGLVGAQPMVDDVVPYDVLDLVFDRYGQDADVAKMRRGVASLFVAIAAVGASADDEAVQAQRRAQLPWTNANLEDPAIPCSPACIQPAVAAYWQTLWDRLHDRFDVQAHPIFWSSPADGAYAHPTDALSIESQLSVAFARSVDLATFTADLVTVTDADGVVHPVDFRFYYRDRSNVLNVWPTEDWADDATYTLTIADGAKAWDGTPLGGPFTLTFHTGPAPEPAVGDDPEPTAATPCGCGTSPRGWLPGLLLLPLLARRRR